MAVTLDATVGGANANVLADLAAADAYMETRLHAEAWADASEEHQKLALIEGTRELSRLAWAGERATAVQALPWPRTDVPDPDAPPDVVTGAQPDIGDDVVPSRAKEAMYEAALEILRASGDISAPDPLDGVRRKKVDVLETEFFEHGRAPGGILRFPRIASLLAPLLATQSWEIARS